MTKTLIEVNFDGLVGPTHHFGGLGVGNLASREYAGRVSNPRAAALQGIEKMERLAAELDPARGRQAVLPPLVRPDIHWLRRLGFTGDDARVLDDARREAPHLLGAAWSASSMWVANAATVSPVADCDDGRTHLTVANLLSSVHRSLEPPQTLALLRQVFPDPSLVCLHAPLPGSMALRDEGAANHMRLCDSRGTNGVEIFVHGDDQAPASGQFPARQSAEACRAVARLHRLDPGRTFYLRQHPAAIDAGAFHNDVVATSYADVLMHHSRAFLESDETLEQISVDFLAATGQRLVRIVIAEERLSLTDAVASYLFNSQLIPRADGHLTLVCPVQCREIGAAERCVQEILEGENRVDRVVYVDLRESMHNGGGPACLRLRVPVDDRTMQSIHAGTIWSPELGKRLRDCVERHYRTHLAADSLSDPEFAHQAQASAEAVWRVLGLNPAAE